MMINLEKILKDSKINLINCSINFIAPEKKENKVNKLEDAFIEDLIKNDMGKSLDEVAKYIQKNIGYALPLKVIKEILNLESEFFVNLNNE